MALDTQGNKKKQVKKKRGKEKNPTMEAMWKDFKSLIHKNTSHQIGIDSSH
jgi:hypothetical protein